MKLLIIITSILFLVYGTLCLITNHMMKEFDRYGLSQFRTLTGVLEILGGAGLLVGILFKPILLISSFGLALLMFLGTGTRLRVKDPWFEIIPAFVLMLVNIFIFWSFV